MKKLILGGAAPLAAGVLLLFLLSSGTVMQFDPKVETVGAETPVRVRLSNPHGIRRFTAWIEQNGKRTTLFERSTPAHRWLFLGRSGGTQDVTFGAGMKKAPELRDGKAVIVVEAVANDLAGHTDTLSAEVMVVTQPPRIAVDDAQHYINQGGAELVSFTVSGYWTEAGVEAGQYGFRSFTVAGKAAGNGKDQRFSLFAFPWDLEPGAPLNVFARSPAAPAGEVKGKFWHKVFPKKFRSRELVLDDAFLERIVNQIDPGGQGDLLARFLRINGEMRRANNKTLADLRFKTEERFVWSGPFLHLAAQVESHFADVRTYIYKGKKVDQQVHLGFDLAHTKHSPIEAANDGKVVFAENLGIYGSCIVVDHGYGLQSIYGHLSEIGVKVGDVVKKSQVMGKSGETGLAGGDHLHFSMQVDGVQINPVEWWDEHWIKDRILSKVGTR